MELFTNVREDNNLNYWHYKFANMVRVTLTFHIRISSQPVVWCIVIRLPIKSCYFTYTCGGVVVELMAKPRGCAVVLLTIFF